ncbi:MAG: hypothetical protein Q4F31_08520, partial [Eubacteriales bacterium]|nr:hypothetical protein [Eubacteriales bacterium]
MKKTRQLLSLLLAGMMLLSVVSAGAFADGESGIILMGTDLTAGVYYYMGGAGPEAYAPDWQPGEGDSYAVLSSDGTLVLHNFKGTCYVSGEDPAAAGITLSSSVSSLTIRLEGDNEILSQGYSSEYSGEEVTCRSYGIYAPGKDITFSGEGSLKISAASLDGVSATHTESTAILAEDITAADNASVSTIAGNAENSFGFYASSVTLSGTGASLSADAVTASFSVFPVSEVSGYDVAVSSDYNQSLTGAGPATVTLAEPYVEQEPVYEQEPAYEQ